MRIDEIITYKLLDGAKQAFADLGIPYIEPYQATVKDLHEGTVGKHRGLYFIFDYEPSNSTPYYIGIATAGNTIHNRFQPHYAKLTVNLAAMFGDVNRPRKETRWQFPKNWRKGMKQHFLDNPDDIPDYWVGRQKHDILQPANLDWKPIFKKEVDRLPVLAWNLHDLDSKQIDLLETAFIRAYRPIFNGSKTQI